MQVSYFHYNYPADQQYTSCFVTILHIFKVQGRKLEAPWVAEQVASDISDTPYDTISEW